MAGRRPEYTSPPDQYYDRSEAIKYSGNSHIIRIQGELSNRAYELLELPDDGVPRMLLDVGCGSGLSGEVITNNGHEWIGIDISKDMLAVAKEKNETESDLILMDMGRGLPFKPGVFDGAISISAIQWLCHSNANSENPRNRLYYFFQMLYASLARGSRAVFQFYPENESQSYLICQQAMRAGFRGGLVIDYPESRKAKKVFLVINAGGYFATSTPRGLTADVDVVNEEHVYVEERGRATFRKGRQQPPKGSRAYINARKERLRRRGIDVRESTKYTGRRRRH